MTEFQVFEPPNTLKEHVAYMYLLERKVKNIANQTPEFILPSGYEIMGIHLKGRWEASFTDNNEIKKMILPEFYLTGQQSIGYELTQKNRETAILGFALKPKTIFNIFGKKPSEFVNRTFPIEEVSSMKIDFLRSILPLENNQKSLDLFAITLFDKIKRKSVVTRTLVDLALEHIHQNKGCLSVEYLCKKLKINKRTLQRFFRAEIGTSPINYIRIIRFNHLVTELKKPENLNLDFQFLSNYYRFYDASHFNKEFKKFCGRAPTSFMTQQHEMLWKLLQKEYSIPSRCRSVR